MLTKKFYILNQKIDIMSTCNGHYMNFYINTYNRSKNDAKLNH